MCRYQRLHGVGPCRLAFNLKLLEAGHVQVGNALADLFDLVRRGTKGHPRRILDRVDQLPVRCHPLGFLLGDGVQGVLMRLDQCCHLLPQDVLRLVNGAATLQGFGLGLLVRLVNSTVKPPEAEDVGLSCGDARLAGQVELHVGGLGPRLFNVTFQHLVLSDDGGRCHNNQGVGRWCFCCWCCCCHVVG